MLEFLNSLEWPGAFTVLGSVVTIVVGIFGYLASLKKKKENAPVDAQQTSEIDKLHTRLSDTKDKIAGLDGDVRELRTYIKSIQKQITDHEHRDIEDFKVIQQKLDKLMEIIIQILQDDA